MANLFSSHKGSYLPKHSRSNSHVSKRSRKFGKMQAACSTNIRIVHALEHGNTQLAAELSEHSSRHTQEHLGHICAAGLQVATLAQLHQMIASFQPLPYGTVHYRGYCVDSIEIPKSGDYILIFYGKHAKLLTIAGDDKLGALTAVAYLTCNMERALEELAAAAKTIPFRPLVAGAPTSNN